MAIEHADFEGVERLALVTGGEIVSTFDRPDLIKLGRCNLIEEVMIGEQWRWTSSAARQKGLSSCVHQKHVKKEREREGEEGERREKKGDFFFFFACQLVF